jgi:enoyl-CoA hydratase
MPYENILVAREGRVGKITLNRPKALNALNAALMSEVASALDEFERDAEIGCVILTGSEKAFAAGADIKQMQEFDYPGV